MNGAEDHGHEPHDPSVHESTHDDPHPVPYEPFEVDEAPVLGEDYRDLSWIESAGDHSSDEPSDWGRGTDLEHPHSQVDTDPDNVVAPSWAQAADPFGPDQSHPALVSHPEQHDPPPDPSLHGDWAFAHALATDYPATWSAEPADHSPPVWDPDTSARLAGLTPQAAGGPDVALPPGVHEGQAAALWHESLPDEPLPLGADGRVLEPAALLDDLVGRVHDLAQADVVRAVRESLTQ